MFDLILGVVLSQPVTSDYNFNVGTSQSTRLQLDKNINEIDGGVYGWIERSSGNQRVRLLGQEVTELSDTSFGVGVNHYITYRLSVFGEVGGSVLKASNKEVVQQEVVYTYLVDRHNVYDRPIPVTTLYPYDQTSYNTDLEYKQSLIFRVGAAYDISHNWRVSAAYKNYSAVATTSLYDAELRQSGGGYWTENNNINLSSFELRVEYKF